MQTAKRALVIGLFIVLGALMAGADCDLNSSDDCLFFCS